MNYKRIPIFIHLAIKILVHESNNYIYFIRWLYHSQSLNTASLQSNGFMKSILIYNLLGQKVYEQSINDMGVILDLSDLPPGNYIARVQGETAQKVLTIVKQ